MGGYRNHTAVFFLIACLVIAAHLAKGAAPTAEKGAKGRSSSVTSTTRRGGRSDAEWPKALSLDAKQQVRLKSIRETYRKRAEALRASNVPPDRRMVRMQALRIEREKQILALLTPAQRTKYKTMRREGMGRGDRIGRRPDAAEMMRRMDARLKLTPVQKRKIDGILAVSRRKQESLRVRAERNTANREKIREEARTARRATVTHIRAVLTPDQRAKLDSSLKDNGRSTGPSRERGATELGRGR